ncbi:MAG: DUF1374 domain-containing protein [Euryarchaeota archaeon]|nr:DUF1374 domain-containing protein [Euryarchaeota archaeon]
MSEVENEEIAMNIKNLVRLFLEDKEISRIYIKFKEPLKIRREDYEMLGKPDQSEKIYPDEDRYEDWFFRDSKKKKLKIYYFKYCEDGDVFIKDIQGWKEA